MDTLDAPNSSARLRVWDLPTRVFHWTLVAAFAFAFVSGESDNGLTGHARAGFLILGLVAFRILWGFVGTRYSRFSALSLSPVQAIDYLRRLPTANRRRYLGHNPAASWAVVGLLGLVTATALTGWRMQATGSEALEEVHEVLAQATLALVVVHVVGALVSSYFHRENLIGGDPSVYVVLRHEADGAGNPVTPHLATLSPDEAKAYGALDLESVERVAMPEALRPRLQAYVAAHHVEEAFVKRRRSGVKADDEEIFGQEPIFARRQRRGASSDSDGSAT